MQYVLSDIGLAPTRNSKQNKLAYNSVRQSNLKKIGKRFAKGFTKDS